MAVVDDLLAADLSLQLLRLGISLAQQHRSRAFGRIKKRCKAFRMPLAALIRRALPLISEEELQRLSGCPFNKASKVSI